MGNHIIDTTIVQNDGKYYRFSKDETFKSIIMEVVDYNMTHLARSEKDS